MRQIGTTGKICIADVRELPVGATYLRSTGVSGRGSALLLLLPISALEGKAGLQRLRSRLMAPAVAFGGVRWPPVEAAILLWNWNRPAANGRSILPIAKGHLMYPADIIVRRAPVDFADWEAVRALIHDAFAYMKGRIDPPSSAWRLTPESMAADAAKGALLLAGSGSTLVGCVFVRRKEDALYIGKLAVRPGLHGSGIGKALVEAARAEARALGLKALELETRIELTKNHDAFARMGFIKTAETAHPGYERPTGITMRAAV